MAWKHFVLLDNRFLICMALWSSFWGMVGEREGWDSEEDSEGGAGVGGEGVEKGRYEDLYL